MKLCFSTLGCPQWRWDDIITAATDLGYDGVELRGVRKEMYVPRIKQLLPDHIEETKKKLAKLNLTVPVLTSGCELQKEDCLDDTIFECKEYIDVANELGASYIRVLGDTSPEPGKNVDTELIKNTAQILGAYAGAKGVGLLIETNGYFSDTKKLSKLLDQINSPHVNALWDINHPFRFNDESAEQTIDNLGDRIKHVHVKDSVILEDGKVAYKVTGQGTLPVLDCVNLLNSRGFDGYYCLEWVRRWDISLEEPGIAFALFSQFMRSL